MYFHILTVKKESLLLNLRVINMDVLDKACFERPMISYDFVLSSVHILHSVASYLVMERMAILQEDKIVVKLDAYLSVHFTEHISISST